MGKTSSPPHQMAYLAELRKESSPAAIAFSAPCPCCGNKKRRCLLPSPPPSRKKLLVLDLPAPAMSPSPLPSSTSLASPPSSVTQISDFVARRTLLALQDSGPFAHLHSAATSLSAVIPPETAAEIRDSGAFNLRCGDPTSPPVKRPADVISPAAKKEPGEMIAPLVGCHYGGGERSTSSGSSHAKPVENDKHGQGGGAEFRVGVKCKCGVTREFVLSC